MTLHKHLVPAGLIVTIIVLALGILANCQRRALRPVDIAAEDMCSFCKMSISEKRYAAEVIDSEGQAYKFDDIGCMVNFVKQKRSQSEVRAYFVMDFDKREWIRGQDAFYVRSSEFTTPMAGGISAFKDESRAQAAVTKYHGKLLSFDDLFK